MTHIFFLAAVQMCCAQRCTLIPVGDVREPGWAEPCDVLHHEWCELAKKTNTGIAPGVLVETGSARYCTAREQCAAPPVTLSHYTPI